MHSYQRVHSFSYPFILQTTRFHLVKSCATRAAPRRTGSRPGGTWRWSVWRGLGRPRRSPSIWLRTLALQRNRWRQWCARLEVHDQSHEVWRDKERSVSKSAVHFFIIIIKLKISPMHVRFSPKQVLSVFFCFSYLLSSSGCFLAAGDPGDPVAPPPEAEGSLRPLFPLVFFSRSLSSKACQEEKLVS